MSFNSHFGGPLPRKLDDLAVIAANLHDINYANPLSQQSKEVIVRSSLDGETFINFKQGPSQGQHISFSASKAQEPMLGNPMSSADLSQNSPFIQGKAKAFNVVPISSSSGGVVQSSEGLIFQHGGAINVRLPMINPLSATLNHNKQTPGLDEPSSIAQTPVPLA